jgi:hypothetical protein
VRKGAGNSNDGFLGTIQLCKSQRFAFGQQPRGQKQPFLTRVGGSGVVTSSGPLSWLFSFAAPDRVEVFVVVVPVDRQVAELVPQCVTLIDLPPPVQPAQVADDREGASGDVPNDSELTTTQNQPSRYARPFLCDR